jgi:UDPglucose 6-dehydrogenase/GDP-mannose 6-dehydrogenase
MQVSIIGTGYVGLVTGACLAEYGHTVTCVDLDPAKADAINQARAPFHEPGLPELLERHAGKRLFASTDLASAVARSEITFIAVGTPASDGRIDLKYVARAAQEIGAALAGKPAFHTVVVKSTVIPGTTEGTVRQCLEEASGKKAGRDFGLGMNPEFLTEGTAVRDFMTPDRLVLGGIDARSQDALATLYAGFDPIVPRIRTGPSTAEMIKYASNALLATLISFSNEIARLCVAVGGVDAIDVTRGVHQSTYLTTVEDGRRRTAPIASFIEAGCGYGGSCLPKDVTALVGQGQALGLPMPMMRSVLEINRGQPDEVMRLIARHYPAVDGVAVTVLGLSFKPDTDDLRESPAFPILERLRRAGARLTAFDPVARPEGHPGLTGVRLADTLRAAVQDAEVIVIVTRWNQFREVPDLLRAGGSRALVVDGRRLLDPAACPRYEGIGRG